MVKFETLSGPWQVDKVRMVASSPPHGFEVDVTSVGSLSFCAPPQPASPHLFPSKLSPPEATPACDLLSTHALSVAPQEVSASWLSMCLLPQHLPPCLHLLPSAAIVVQAWLNHHWVCQPSPKEILQNSKGLIFAVWKPFILLLMHLSRKHFSL